MWTQIKLWLFGKENLGDLVWYTQKFCVILSNYIWINLFNCIENLIAQEQIEFKFILFMLVKITSKVKWWSYVYIHHVLARTWPSIFFSKIIISFHDEFLSVYCPRQGNHLTAVEIIREDWGRICIVLKRLNWLIKDQIFIQRKYDLIPSDAKHWEEKFNKNENNCSCFDGIWKYISLFLSSSLW